LARAVQQYSEASVGIRKNVGKDGWAFAVCALGTCLILAAACAGGDTPPRDDVLEEKIRSTYDPDFETGVAGSASMAGTGGGGGQGGSAVAGGTGGGAAGSASVAGSGSTGDICDAPTKVLTYYCGLGSGCHGAEANFGDFGASEEAARALVDKSTKNASCGKYIDSADPESSAILTKLSDPTCGGAQMPFGSKPLAQADVDCVRSWLSQF